MIQKSRNRKRTGHRLTQSQLPSGSRFCLRIVYVLGVFLCIVSAGNAATVTGLGNIPDPFNNTNPPPNNATTISYSLSETNKYVEVEITDSDDVTVRRLYGNITTDTSPGHGWDGTDDSGGTVAAGSYKAKVRAAPSLQYVMKIQGQGNYFAAPTDLAVDDAGNVFVADTFGYCIQKYNTSGTRLWKRGISGSGSPAPGSEPQFNRPYGIAVHRDYLTKVNAGSSQAFRNFKSSQVYAAGSWGVLNGTDVIFSDGFETDTGWTGTGEWARGAPVSGPGAAYEGTRVWATNLAGNYSKNTNQNLTSPVIDCSGRTGVMIRFARHLELNAGDTGTIYVYDGSSWNQVVQYGSDTDDTTYQIVEFDISAYADNNANVQVRFNLTSNNNFQDVGWYIDSFEVYAPRTISTGTGIVGTDLDSVYQVQQTGDTTLEYRFDVPAATYNVVLHFAEIEYNTPATRIFDIALEGTVVQDNFDIFTAAGGADTALAMSYQVYVSDGELNITFPQVMAGSVAVGGVEVKTPITIFVADTFNERIQKLDSNGYVIDPNWASVDNPGREPVDQFLGMDADEEYLFVAYERGGTSAVNGLNALVRSYRISDPTTYYSSEELAYGDEDWALLMTDVAGHDSNDDGIFDDIYATWLFEYGARGNPSHRDVDIAKYPVTAGAPGTKANELVTTTVGPFGLTFDNSGTTKYWYCTDINSTEVRKYQAVAGDSNDTEVTIGGFPFGSVGTGTGSQMRNPQGIAYDELYQAIWVADSGNNRLKKFDSSGNLLLTVASDPGSVSLSNPTDLAVDTANNLYVADSGSSRILKFDPQGNLLLSLGSQKMIEPEGEGDHTADTDKLWFPQGVAVDSTGNIFVADSYNERVTKFDSTGTPLRTLVLDNGTGGTNWDNNDWPMGMDIDTSQDRLIWMHNEDYQSRIKWCSLDLTGVTYTNAQAHVNENVDSLDVVADSMWSRAWASFSGDSSLRYYNITASDAGAPLFSGSHYTGMAIDPFDNIYVSNADDDRVYVYRIYDTNYPAASLDLPANSNDTIISSFGGTGSGNGQFNHPAGIALTHPDALGNRYLWVADSRNNRIQKFRVLYDDEEEDIVTVEDPSGSPNVTSVSLAGRGVTYYNGSYYARAGTVTVNVVFSETMDTSVSPLVKINANGVETVVRQVSYSSNTWTGTVNIAAGNDDLTTTLYVSGAKDFGGTLLYPNPNTHFNFVVDTTPPGRPTVYQPDSPQTQSPISVTGLSEAYAMVDVYNYNAETGGSEISSQLGIQADSAGNFTAVSIDLDNPPPNFNYIFAKATDVAGNVSAESTPRRVVEYTTGDPGRGSITPDAKELIGTSGTWAVRYTASVDMGDGSLVLVYIPVGWTEPNETSGIAGYTTVQAGPGMNLIASPNDVEISGRVITVNFNASGAGSYFDVIYGNTAGGGPGSTIGYSASFGKNFFYMKSSNAGSDLQSLEALNSPYVYVYGEPVRASYTSSTPASVFKGESNIQVMTLTFANDNVQADVEVQGLILEVQDSTDAGIVPNSAISRVVVKDLATTYVSDESIESGGNAIALDMTSTPIEVPAGESKTVEVYVNINGNATATSFRVGLASSASVTAVEALSQEAVDVTPNAGYLFPMKTSAATIESNAQATTLSVQYQSQMPMNVSKGQSSAKAMVLKFNNVKGSSTPNYIEITGLDFTVKNSAGAVVADPSSVISRIMLKDQNTSAVYLDTTGINSSGGKIVLDLVLNPIEVRCGTTRNVDVYFDVYNSTTATSVKLGIEAASDVRARDSILLTSVTVTGNGLVVFPEMSAAATIQDAARIRNMQVSVDPAGSIVIGEVFSVTVDIEYTGGQANARLYSSESDLSFSINGINKTGEFSIEPDSGNPSQLIAGVGNIAHMKYLVVQDKGTSSGELTIDSSPTGPQARDANDATDSDPMVITDTDGADNTASVTVVSTKADAVACAITGQFYAAGATGVPVLSIVVTNNQGADDTITTINIYSANGQDSAIRDVDIFLESGATAGFQPAQDITELSGSAGAAHTFSGGRLVFTGLSQTVSAMSDIHFYVVYDLSTQNVQDRNVLNAYIPTGGIELSDAGQIETFQLNSPGRSTVNIVANTITIDAEDSSAAVGGQELLTIRAVDAYGNIDTDSAQNITLSLTGSGRVYATTLTGGSTGGSSTNGNLTSGQGTVTITDAVEETVTASISSALAINGREHVVFSQLISAVSNAVSNRYPRPGSANVAVLDFEVTNGTAAGDTIESIAVRSLCTKDQYIADIDLYRESGATSGFQAGEDVLLSSGTDVFDQGNVTFNLTQAIGAGQQLRFYVSFDLGTAVSENNTLDAYVPTQGISLTTAGGIDTMSLNSSGVQTIKVDAATIRVTATDGEASIGSTETLTIVAYDAYNNLDTDYAGNVQISVDGSAIIYSTTLVGGTTGGNSTVGKLTNGGASVTIADNTAETVTVLPVSGLTANISDVVTFTGAVVNANPVTDVRPGPGSANVVILDFTVTNVTTITDDVEAIDVTNLSVAGDGVIADVSLFYDSNNDNSYSPGVDTRIGDTGHFSGGLVSFSGTSFPVTVASNNGTERFFVVVSVSDNATYGVTLDARVPIDGITMSNSGTIGSNPVNSTGYLTVWDYVAPTATLSMAPSINVGLDRIAVTINISEPVALVPFLQVKPPSSSTRSIVLSGSGSEWSGSVQVDSSFGSGTAYFSVRVTDNYSNVCTTLEGISTFSIDLVVPTASVVTVNPYPVAGSGNMLCVTLQVSELLQQAPTFTFTAADGTGYAISLQVTGNTTYYGQLQIDNTMAEGVATFSIELTDRVGNTGNTLTGGIVTVSVDVTGPTVTLNHPAAGGFDNDSLYLEYQLSETCGEGSVILTFLHTGGTPDLNAPHVVAAGLQGLSGVNSITVSGNDLAGDGTATVSDTLVDGAVYTVSAYAIDHAGNAGPVTINTGFTYDVQAPAPAANLISTAFPGDKVSLVWDASPSTDVEAYYVYRGTSADEITSNIASTINTLYDDVSVVVSQNYFYRVRAADRAGNESSPTGRTTAPQISVSKQADIFKEGVPFVPVPGASICYRITFTNVGYGPATTIVITDRVPTQNTDYVTGSAGSILPCTVNYRHDLPGVYDSSESSPITGIRWSDFPALDAGQQGVVTYSVTIK